MEGCSLIILPLFKSPPSPPPHATQLYVLNHYLFRSSSTCLRCPFMICNVSSSCCILVSNYIGQLKQSKVRITEELCCVMDYKQVSLEGTNEYSDKRYINILSKVSFIVDTELQIFIKNISSHSYLTFQMSISIVGIRWCHWNKIQFIIKNKNLRN